MVTTADLQGPAALLRVAVAAVLVLATAYHLSRLLRGRADLLDAAHALMGAAMLVMLAGWLGRGPDLAAAVLFAALAVAALFSRHRIELVIGCAAMVLMLVAGSATSAPHMAGMAGMGHAAVGGPAVALVVVAVVALLAVAGRVLVRACAGAGESGEAVAVPAACRDGMSLAAVYMLVLMVP